MKDKIHILVYPILVLLLCMLIGLFYYVNKNSEDTGINGLPDAGFDDPEAFNRYFNGIRKPIKESESEYSANYAYEQLLVARKNRKLLKSGGNKYMWTHRGPGNVGGRTRSILIDQDDVTLNTWFAASASGGVWKTTDGGKTWQSITEFFPNLATNCIAMAPSDHNVLYVGTGEGYGGIAMVKGNGIFKSSDKGLNWEQIISTVNNEDFYWINKILVDHGNAENLIVATNSGIFKYFGSEDTWVEVFNVGRRVQDLVISQMNPNTIYAAVNSIGIIKSFDNGESWIDISDGLGSGQRYSVDVSRADTNYVYAGIETSGDAQIFLSKNGGVSWYRMHDTDGSFSNYLKDLGWFSNAIRAHPFDKNKVFAAGVELIAVEFQPGISESDPEVVDADTIGTSSFLDFVNYGGSFLWGGMSTGIEEGADVEEVDFSDVEIRFGPGQIQKAYRFTVPIGEGSGVPTEDYEYKDYINVPFEVWDTDNNRQLMVSFRDQERDGEFNLIQRSANDEISGREYLFVHAVEYSETPGSAIAKDGGHFYKMTYSIWPELAKDGTWNPENLPESKIFIEVGTFLQQDAQTTIIADYTKQDILHVDHHDIQIGIISETEQNFMVVEGNDGGLGVSWDNGSSWDQISDGYLTAQVYGVAKRKYAQQYLIGMQDNGSWLSDQGEDAGSESEFSLKVDGDGFEALWHPLEPNKMLASAQNNRFRVSLDNGNTWLYAQYGIQGRDGPFISRLAHSPQNPDLVFAISAEGVYRHTNFGIGTESWDRNDLGSSWSNLTGEAWHFADVEVSLADPAVVWAGSAMSEDPKLKIFVSENYGISFKPVENYTERELGYISGLTTHPTDPATAYVLFSIANRPKILRTTNFGETWEDISGFGKNSVSSNGFPDVAVYSLMVHKFNTDWIWAGTEIGIFESVDNGETWYFADNGLPAVSIWKMFLQDNEVIVATYGRGIWSAPQWPGSIDAENMNKEFMLKTFPNPSNGIVNIYLESENMGPICLSVFNWLGQKVLFFEDRKYTVTYENSLNIRELPAGNYILLLEIERKQYSAKINLEQ